MAPAASRLDAMEGSLQIPAMEKESTPAALKNHLRFHAPHGHLAPVFGNDWFAHKAEAFARFFGTPAFLVGQTVIVAVWIALNSAGVFHFDIYPVSYTHLTLPTNREV